VPQAVTLLRRIQSVWTEADGCCARCFDSITKTLVDAEGQAERLDAQGNFREYYRRVLTAHESRMWRHCNPDIATWRRKVIIEETATAADAAGFEAFAVFDMDEVLLAQGV
jgi:hypothetical protein